MQNLNSVIEFLKGQVQERENEWNSERLQYQQTIADLRSKLEEQKNLNKELSERLNSIKFAFQPIADNIKKPSKVKKNLHSRVKSDTFLQKESHFMEQRNQTVQDKKEDKKPLLLNFLKELNEEDSLSPNQVNSIIQLPSTTKMLTTTASNYMMTTSILSGQTQTSHLMMNQKYHHQRSNSNGAAATSLFAMNAKKTVQLDINTSSYTEREEIVGKNLLELKGSLRSHLDGIRAVQFEQSLMATASEDCTIKLWDIEQLNSINQNVHAEPLCTIRQHLGPIFALTSYFKSPMIHFYSAGVDGIIRSYSSLSSQAQNYEVLFSWHAHTDVIWSLKHHPFEQRLISSSADGSVKMWKSLSLAYSEVQNKGNLNLEMLQNPLANFTFKKSMNGLSIPTAIEWICKGFNENIICGYSDTLSFIVYDVSNVKQIQQIRFEQEYNQISAQPNKILFNPELKYYVSGHEDNKIRFCDINSGKLFKSLIAHTDAVTDLCSLQNLYQIATVSHDGSLRTWDIRKFQCIHEIPAHKQKFDEGIHAISNHNSLVVTGGADGIVKIFNQNDII